MTAAASPLALAFSQGWLMMGGLIVAIGAQNAFVLRHGLLRSHVGPVVALCALSDWALTALGVFGLGGLVASSATASELLRWFGAAFLSWYALRAAYHPHLLTIQPRGDDLHVFAVNERTLFWRGPVTVKRVRFDGTVLAEWTHWRSRRAKRS